MKKYYDGYFVDKESGEDFLVELEVLENETTQSFKNRLKKVAAQYFSNAVLLDLVNPAYAEMLGLDTY